MNALIALFRREPVLLTTLAAAVVAAAVTFGLHLSPEQQTAVYAVIAAVAAIFARSQVSPTPPGPGPDPHTQISA